MERSKHIKGLGAFILITVFSVGLILYFTFSEDTVSAVKNLEPGDILILLILWFAVLSFDGLAIYLMAAASGEKVRLSAGLGTSAFKYFFNMITPVGLGGAPSMIYYLTKEGVPPGKSSSAILTKIMMNAALILLGAQFAFAENFSLFREQRIIFTVFVITSIVQAGFILSIIMIILLPHYLIGIITKAGNYLSRYRFFRKAANIRKFLVLEASAARRSFRYYFKHHIILFLCAVCANGISYISSLTIMFFVLRSFGITVAFPLALSFGALLIFIIGFLPTPGGSGLAETLFVLFLSNAAPVYILGVAVILWRFFLYYLSAGIGLVISVKYLSDFTLGKRK